MQKQIVKLQARTGLVGKAEETEVSKETGRLENALNKISSSDFIKREDK